MDGDVVNNIVLIKSVLGVRRPYFALLNAFIGPWDFLTPSDALL